MVDPVFRHARREALIIVTAWLAATAYSCVYCYVHGYNRSGFTPTVADLKPILGMPSWFVWGVIAPWLACGAFTVLFAGFGIDDDDLGTDHAAELEADIREGAGTHD